MQAEIIVNTLGSWRNEVGFIIRDKNGVALFTRLPGITYYANTIFGTFCPSCLNYADVRLAQSDIAYDEAKDLINKYSDSSIPVAPTPTNDTSNSTITNTSPPQTPA